MSDPSIEVSLDALAVDISVIETAIEVQHPGSGIDGEVEVSLDALAVDVSLIEIETAVGILV